MCGEKIKKVLIIGGGRRGLAAVEILSEDPGIRILAVIDTNPGAAGIRLAERLGIRTDTNWEHFIGSDDLSPDAVLNLTDNMEVEARLRERSGEKNIELFGGVTKRIIDSLLVERQVQAELHRVSRRMTEGIGLDELLVLILSSCVKSAKADIGIIMLAGDNAGSLEIKSKWGITEEDAARLAKKAAEKLPSWPENEEAMPLCSRDEEAVSAEFATSLCAPLRSRGCLTGALIVANRETDKIFPVISRRLLSTFANQATVAIENILLYKKSELQSITDGLTGLFNHRYFQEQLEAELSRAQRYDHNLSLIIIDLDNFKEINDTYGHPKGDDILKKVSRFLQKAVRQADIVCRYGGDEFVVILPETPKDGALIVGERIRKGMEDNILNSETPVKVSLGLSAYPVDGVFGQDLIKKADGALYKAKEGGRNRIFAA